MWDVLEIKPTNDERAVKRAYARLLKQNRPDKDPKAFQELRDAYEWCLRATKWSDYDDEFDDDEFVDADAQENAVGADDSAEQEEDADAPLEPFIPPDEPAARVVVNDDGAPSVPLTEPAARVVVDEESSESTDWAVTGKEERAEDREAAKVVVEGYGVELPVDRSQDETSQDDAGFPGTEDEEIALAALVEELDQSLSSPERARDADAWKNWFASTDTISLVDRERLRMTFVDRVIDRWYDDEEATTAILKNLPHSALAGFQDLLGWPQSEAELGDIMPDDLVLLLGEMLDFELMSVEDRLAYFEESDPDMVDAAMDPASIRHSNGFRYGPFWCLYRKQNRRVGMALGGPVMVSGICAGVAAAGVQILMVIALIAIFLFYRAGNVRIWWPLLCVVLAIAAMGAFGPAAFGPALYLVFFVPLHIEAGLKGRQWREMQLKEAFGAMPGNIRSDPVKRRNYLRRAGEPSRKAPTMLLAATALVVGLIGAIGIGIYIEDNWKTSGRDLSPPASTDTLEIVPGLPDLNKLLNEDRDRSTAPE